MELDFKTLKQGKRSQIEISDLGNGCFALNSWKDGDIINTIVFKKEVAQGIMDFINSKEKKEMLRLRAERIRRLHNENNI